MKTTNSRSGFGIIEIMLAIVAMSILVLTVSSMLYYGWLGWRRNNQSVEMQRDATLAMRAMAKEVRGATTVSVSASSLVCVNPSNTVRFAKSGSKLGMQVDGSLRMYLIQNSLNSFTPAIDSTDGSVDITLNLVTEADSASVTGTFYRRNAP